MLTVFAHTTILDNLMLSYSFFNGFASYPTVALMAPDDVAGENRMAAMFSCQGYCLWLVWCGLENDRNDRLMHAACCGNASILSSHSFCGPRPFWFLCLFYKSHRIMHKGI